MTVATGLVEVVLMLEGLVVWRSGDEYYRERVIMSQTYSRCMHPSDQLGKHDDARTLDLRKDSVGVGFRFEVARQSLRVPRKRWSVTRLG